jgi:hypothetical protein
MHGFKPNRYDRQPARPVLSLHHGSRVLLTVVADPMWECAFRIQWPDGAFSDIGNLSRIKDAAEVICEHGPPPLHRRDLRWKQGGEPHRGSLVSGMVGGSPP